MFEQVADPFSIGLGLVGQLELDVQQPIDDGRPHAGEAPGQRGAEGRGAVSFDHPFAEARHERGRVRLVCVGVVLGDDGLSVSKALCVFERLNIDLLDSLQRQLRG
jgi:hypothetical protein